MLFRSPICLVLVAAGLSMLPPAMLAQRSTYTALVVDSKQSAPLAPADVTLDLAGHVTTTSDRAACA